MPKEQEPEKSWQEIAEELVKQRDSERAVAIADRLDRAIEKELDQGRKTSSKCKQGSVA